MNLNYLEETIRTSKYLVCLAGMEFMREQNVAYHRDSDESYRIEEKYGYSPEELFSARMFNTHAELFYEYYRNEILSKHLEAGKGNEALARLEEAGYLKTIITKGIYNMPQKAGCKNVINMYGNIYENNAYDIQQELKLNHPELNLTVLIGSVRNTSRIESVIETYRPDVIYHAAAHKHVPLMEDSPNEAIKNNVFGTYKTARAADKFGVKRFVLISTDKAVNPTNIMGASKRMCEMIIQTFNRYSKTEYVAVRFGNVLGSNGSVIPLFKRQMAAGGPLTVTHPDIIRYFMTIPEAVSLVLEAGAFAKGGEIFVLDMGEPVKIADLAKNLIRLSGYTLGVDMDIKYTGLRPGEKLYEELLVKEEGIQKTDNNLIYIGKPLEFNEVHFLSGLRELEEAAMNESLNVKQIVSEIVPTYHIRQEDLKRDEEVNKELRELGKISHEKPVMED